MLEIISNAKNFISELGIDIFRDNLEEMHNVKLVKADIENYILTRQDKEFYEGYTIDYKGYLSYIRNNMIDEIKNYIFTIDYDTAKSLEVTILAKAKNYAFTEGSSVKTIEMITQNCISIIKNYYEEKLDDDDRLLGHITVQTILEKISPQLIEVSNNVERLADAVVIQGEQRNSEYNDVQNKLEQIHDQLKQRKNPYKSNEYNSSFMVVFCEEDQLYVDELETWFNSNDIEYSKHCCKKNISDEAINSIDESVLLIFIVGKTFLENINCVYYLSQKMISDNNDSRIIPVVIDSTIFTHENRIKLILYWEHKEKELREMIKSLDRFQHAYELIAEDLVKCERISQIIDEVINKINKKNYPIGINQVKEVLKKKNYRMIDSIKLISFKQYEQLTKKGGKFQNLNIVQDIFPEATLFDLEYKGVDEKSNIQPLKDFVKYHSKENQMLIGEGGIGKTSMLFYIMKMHYLGNPICPQIPIYIELNKCPSQLDSWSFDDKNSVFIEKYIAALLLEVKDVDKRDPIINKLQIEFKKDPKNGIPQYIILLDGLNEVASNKSQGYPIRNILENEISQSLMQYKNVRFIITSRSHSSMINQIKTINILGINNEVISDYLIRLEQKNNWSKEILNEVLKNDSLIECLRIPLFLNMFGVAYDNTTITTRGEILREFFNKKQIFLYSDQIEHNEINAFILNFIVPEIAWKMSINDTFFITFEEIHKTVSDLLTNDKESIPLNKHTQMCFHLKENPKIYCDKLICNYTEIEMIKEIVYSLEKNLAIMYVDDGKYVFKHQHFRDYFASVHIINLMKIGTYLFINDLDDIEKKYFDDLKNYRLNKSTINFISEAIGLHHSNPKYIDSKWTSRLWDNNNTVILNVLNVFREHFDNDVGWIIWNIVQIINSSGMGLLGIDLSDLDLRNINFNGILCGNGLALQQNATIFYNSIVDLKYFLPISHYDIVKFVEYSNDGQYILTVSDNEMIVWDFNYEYINKLNLKEKISKAIFSKNCSFVICVKSSSKIIIWDLWKDKINEFNAENKIIDISLSAENRYVYIALSNNSVKKFDIFKMKWLNNTLRFQKGNITQILFNTKYNKVILRTREGKIFISDEKNCYDIEELDYFNVQTMTQNIDGEVFGIIANGIVEIGDLFCVETDEYLSKIINPSIIQFSPDGKFVGIVSDMNVLRTYSTEYKTFKRPLSCELTITSLAFSLNNKYVITTAGEKFSKIWDIKSDVGVCIKPLGDIADWIRNAYYSPDGNYIATSSIDSTGKVWDRNNNILKNIFFGHKDRVTSISFDYSGNKVVTTSDDCSIKIWDSNNSRCLKTLKKNNNSVHNAAFSKNGEKLATVSWDTTGSIWNLMNDNEKPKCLIGHKQPVLTILFNSSCDYLISSSNDNTAILWDAKTGENLGIQAKHDDRLNSAAFSPDDKYIITSSFDKTAKIWKRVKNKKIEFVKSLEGHTDSVRSALFSPDGNLIVTVSRDMTGKLWDGHDFSHKKNLNGHTFFVRSAMFDKESKKIVTSSYDGTIREWNIEGECINTIYSIPGLFVCGCDFRNLNSKSLITEEQKKIFSAHGAIMD